jgi:hypothetical protein
MFEVGLQRLVPKKCDMVAAVAVVAMMALFGFRNKVCRRDKVGNELYICFSDHRVCDCEEKGVVYLASYLHGVLDGWFIAASHFILWTLWKMKNIFFVLHFHFFLICHPSSNHCLAYNILQFLEL